MAAKPSSGTLSAPVTKCRKRRLSESDKDDNAVHNHCTTGDSAVNEPLYVAPRRSSDRFPISFDPQRICSSYRSSQWKGWVEKLIRRERERESKSRQNNYVELSHSTGLVAWQVYLQCGAHVHRGSAEQQLQSSLELVHTDGRALVQRVLNEAGNELRAIASLDEHFTAIGDQIDTTSNLQS